ncbi:Zinc finger and SCAN domain-containing [Argiope bruennichi]|uniref:Zinc finger and SCAN domain-containing n=1 Tax=Argiope bruennichi TaxID=94029 RepID=A0A8T0FD74_ARGBR|nr:Zinc finger and SCAN domain-containing [Argiope bruennichi]
MCATAGEEKCVVRKALSDTNNVSGTANSTVNPDLPSINNKPINGKIHVSGNVMDKYTSLPQDHNNNKKTITNFKESVSTKEDDNGVDGPSGMYLRKKFYCSLCPKEFDKNIISANIFGPTLAIILSCVIYAEKNELGKGNSSVIINPAQRKSLLCVLSSEKLSLREIARNISGLTLKYGLTNAKFLAHSEKEKMFISVEEPISKKEDDNAVAGFSGFCSRKKKFPKTFRRKDTLKTNYQTHTGNKLFVCDICEKDFSRKSHLDQHYRMHTGEKPYECGICGKKCSRKENLIVHYRTHLGDKPFMCDICNKSFAYKGYLNTHFRTHTGVKPYKCPACEMSFINSSNCKKHYRSKHE